MVIGNPLASPIGISFGNSVAEFIGSLPKARVMSRTEPLVYHGAEGADLGDMSFAVFPLGVFKISSLRSSAKSISISGGDGR